MSQANRFLARLRGWMQSDPQKVFAHWIGAAGEHALTWGWLATQCARFAGAYAAAGAANGSVVLIFLRHRPELYPAFLGAMQGGWVPSYMPCSSPKQDLQRYWKSHVELLARIRPGALLTDAATHAEMLAAGLDLSDIPVLLIDDLPAAFSHVTSADPAGPSVGLLQHSSGTTGLKKGVALPFDAIASQLDAYGETLGLTQHDVIVSWLPLYHDMGLIACLLLPTYWGVPFVHMDAFAWLGRPDMLFENIVRHGGTFTWLPNFAFNHLAATVGPRAATFKLAGVRAFINCSEPCKPASFDRFQAAFAASGLQAAQLQCCYAMAETVFAASQSGLLTPPARVRVLPDMLEPGRQISPSADPLIGVEIMSSGAPLPGVTVSVHDATGAELAPGTVGEIAIACPFLFTEYNQEPERSAACLRDGRYFTRDIGFVHQGQVYVLGRVDDLIIINGRNLYGHEVEAAVNAISGVKAGRAVAIGHFDARVGSQALIIIAERDPAVAVPDAQIRRAISQSVHAIFNVMPRTVHLVDLGWLIKTTSGKIGRAANLQKFLSTQNREVT